ncbi:PAS domain S-box protein [Maricaulis sp.]|uniref:PAS domain-containing sensor histidine kinase n=1 Tax=Maricaulis sp. TaxID=1486257 RepID=UPI0025C2C58C|nr:PAS domain S-box protein [Maricaulis sp.]
MSRAESHSQPADTNPRSEVLGTRERRTEEREAALRAALVQAALDCIVIIDSDGLIVEFNDSAERTFGHMRDAVLGQPMAELIIPEALRGAHDAGLAKYLASGEHAVLGKRIEVPALHASGRQLLVELAIIPVHLKDQTYFTAYLRDITEKKADEAELKRSRQRYRDLFERSGDAIFIHTLDGEIVDVNARAEELVGWDRQALVGMRLPRLHPEADHPTARDAIKSVQEAGEARMDIRFIHRSGVEIPTEVNARAFEADDRTLVHGVVRDVSERALTEAELRMAKAEAERASAAKTEFLANMSHEMRTPLNGVIGPLGLIKRDGLADETARLIDLAERSAESLLTLIDAVLDISHIESGRVDLDEEPYSPNGLLEQVREIFSNSAAEKGVSLEVASLPTDLRLIGDPGRVRQILFNLVGNAIKFTSDGGVTVDARLRGVAPDQEINFIVLDTGIGIAEDVLPKLFSRFEQGSGSPCAVSQGVGLGLAISRELAELMGGQVDATSLLGAGSKFSVTLPAVLSQREQAEDANPAAPALHLHGRVLLAEDSETNAAVVASMLAKLGLEPEIVADGAAAVQAVDSGTYDLIIMDVGMPVMDGLEASRLIRAAGYATPIIALTAHALSENRKQTRAAGMNGFLTKPIRSKDLSRELEKWLPRAEAAHHIVLSAAHIDEQWDGDAAGYAFVLRIFVRELRERLGRISESLLAGDTAKVQYEAHAIKGGASNVGADALSHAAARLEQACSTDNRGRPSDSSIADLKRAAELFLPAAETSLAQIEGASG